MSKHTPGPWFADSKGSVWRRDPKELYENGGCVAGDRPIALASVGWSGEGRTGYPLQANANLIAAAPELLEALELIVMERAWYRSERPEGYNIEDRLNAWEETARYAIAKAKGEQQC